MSGGYFSVPTFPILEIAEQIERAILRAENEGTPFPPEVLDALMSGIGMLQAAHVFANRIDYFLKGDDDEESFLERLNSELDLVIGHEQSKTH